MPSRWPCINPSERLASFAVQRLDLKEVVLECSLNVEVFVTVNGIRRGLKDRSHRDTSKEHP